MTKLVEALRDALTVLVDDADPLTFTPVEPTVERDGARRYVATTSHGDQLAIVVWGHLLNQFDDSRIEQALSTACDQLGLRWSGLIEAELVLTIGSGVEMVTDTGGVAALYAPVQRAGSSMRRLHDVEMTVTAELGRTKMTLRNILELTPGAVVELDRVAGSPIDVLVNGRPVARGEVVVVDEEFGVRLTEILSDGDE